MSTNFVSMRVGQRYAYKRMFIHLGSKSIYGIPDTSVGYTNFEIRSDTMLGYELFYLVDGIDYLVEQDTILQVTKKFAVCNSDLGIKIIVFPDTNMLARLPTSPAKIRIDDNSWVAASAFGFPTESALHRNGAANDTSLQFCFAIRFPLEVGRRWPVWYDKDGYTKEYANCEAIEIAGRTVSAARLRWIFTGTSQGGPREAYDWYGTDGLLLREFWLDDVPAIGADNDTLGIMRGMRDRIEYLGPEWIDPDTLKPWGAP